MTALPLYVVEKGSRDNPCIVLIHGLLGASRNLSRLQQIFVENGFYTLAYDQRGHGHSPHFAPENYTLEILAEDLLEILDQRNIPTAHLVGHSLGGKVALYAQSISPSSTQSITLLDVGPKISKSAFRALHSIIDPLPENFSSRSEAEDFLDKSLPLTGREKLMYQMFLVSNLTLAKPDGTDSTYSWLFHLAGIKASLLPSIAKDASDLWNNVACPSLILRGAESKHFTQEDLTEAIQINPKCKTKIIQNAGHWLHSENIEQTSLEVLTFLKSIDTKS